MSHRKTDLEILCRLSSLIIYQSGASPPCVHVGHLRPDRVKQHFDPTLWDAPRNEHDPAAAIIGRPALKPGWRMKDMLDAMDHRRPIGALYKVHNTLEAQEISAAVLGKRFEKEGQSDGPNRLPAHDRVGFDVGVMPGVGMPLGVLRQPGMDLKRRGLLITEIGAEEDWRIDPATIRTQNRRASV